MVASNLGDGLDRSAVFEARFRIVVVGGSFSGTVCISGTGSKSILDCPAVSALVGVPVGSSHSRCTPSFSCPSSFTSGFDLLKRLDIPNLELRRFRLVEEVSATADVCLLRWLLRFGLNKVSVGTGW